MTIDRIDPATCTLVIETLKRRRRGVFRAVPVRRELIALLLEAHRTAEGFDAEISGTRVWPVSRTTGWKWVKMAMGAAKIDNSIAKPKALRHAFAVEAVRQRIALSLIQKWLGHARIETTAIGGFGGRRREGTRQFDLGGCLLTSRLQWREFVIRAEGKIWEEDQGRSVIAHRLWHTYWRVYARHRNIEGVIEDDARST